MLKLFAALGLSFAAATLFAEPPPLPEEFHKATPVPLDPAARPTVTTQPFLGILAAPVSKTLAAQLGLEASQGYAIEHLQPDSPAAKAGLLETDLILKINGQALNNEQPMALHLSTFKAGDEITLGLLRASKPLELKVKLGAKKNSGIINRLQVDPASQLPMILNPEDFINGALPPEILERLRGINGGDHAQQIQELMVELQRLHQMPGQGKIHQALKTSSSVSIHDQDGSYQLAPGKDGTQTFTAKDQDGSLIFEGPYTDEKDRAKIPAELLPKLKQIEDLLKGISFGVFTENQGAIEAPSQEEPAPQPAAAPATPAKKPASATSIPQGPAA